MIASSCLTVLPVPIDRLLQHRLAEVPGHQ
jgi:hypothetical protein